MHFDIAEELLNHFAASPLGPLLALPDLLHTVDHPLNESLRRCLDEIPTTLVSAKKTDFRSGNRVGVESDLDEDVRQSILIGELNNTISRLRLKSILQRTERPLPYSLPELSDLVVDADGLVAMREFDFNGSVLERNGRAFMMAPFVESTNSPYWFLLQAAQHKLTSSLRIRLDPYLHGPATSFPNIKYLMQVYGRRLDWQQLAQLKSSDHGRWAPDVQPSDSTFTDYVWEPRNNELHFICEELPSEERLERRGARYLHAVYRSDHAEIIHLDGALRIYTKPEFDLRKGQHVRLAGKAGQRVKLFRIDAPVSRDCLGDLAATFFVWNYDVARYFSD